MAPEVWAPIIGVAGVLLGILIDAGLRKYLAWKARPKLIISKVERQEAETYVRHSIRVTNDGRTAAKNCNALLSINGMAKGNVIDDSSRPAYVRTGNYRPVKDESLCWSFQIQDPTGKPINPAFLSISPKSTRLVELCIVQRDSLEIEIPSEMGWKIGRVILRGNNEYEVEYEVELKIFAENVQYDPEKHAKKFKLIPSNEKKDIVVECQT